MTKALSWRQTGFTLFAWVQFFVLAGIATYYLLAPSPGDSFDNVWDKALHFAGWFILLCSLKIPWLLRSKFWLPALLLFAYSILLEVLQQFSPPREFSVNDMLANGLGILTAFAILLLLNPLLQGFVVKRLLAFVDEEAL